MHEDIIHKATDGDVDAIRELIALQRQGKSLRIYPEGRRGPLDEGFAPLIIGPSPDKLIRFSLGTSKSFGIPKRMIGPTILTMVGLSVDIIVNDEIERLEGLENVTDFKVFAENGMLFMMFLPGGNVDYDIGVRTTQQVIAAWLRGIVSQGWWLEDCGLTTGIYLDVWKFSNNNEEER